MLGKYDYTAHKVIKIKKLKLHYIRKDLINHILRYKFNIQELGREEWQC